jgi:S1 RNA binding domain protein
MEIGGIYTGKVTGITKFGAFVALDGGGTGMVHISEISHSYVEDIRAHLTEEQEVTVKVVSVSPEGRANFSIKKAAAPPPRKESAVFTGVPRRAPAAPATFEDKLKAFMADSESKMSGMKDKHGPPRKRR